jgi:hypothetical protein
MHKIGAGDFGIVYSGMALSLFASAVVDRAWTDFSSGEDIAIKLKRENRKALRNKKETYEALSGRVLEGRPGVLGNSDSFTMNGEISGRRPSARSPEPSPPSGRQLDQSRPGEGQTAAGVFGILGDLILIYE